MVERVCGTPKDKIRLIWDMIASTATKDRAMTILYALGWTQHSIGSQNAAARWCNCCSATSASPAAA
jgi:formate dehydrogenase major subunit